ncbi:BQ5605_C037g11574 [Microbotryum silenes-dioicae]|uniref:Iron-sulfur clusters transporter ATM1, mitochondrial n=1 Tax=Microbotryum silenes-dioicae TaxID=796604 RepID=A0A2X0PA54_9BASI|nr:BQ5605_C037g11574 [Microbotryum silenes-dioicae]
MAAAVVRSSTRAIATSNFTRPCHCWLNLTRSTAPNVHQSASYSTHSPSSRASPSLSIDHLRRRPPHLTRACAWVRSHAHMARSGQPDDYDSAAKKATQQHSGPEGHQKEESSKGAPSTTPTARISNASETTATSVSPVPPAKSDQSNTTDVGKTTEISDKEQSRRDWEIIKKLVPNVWPKNDWSTKTRVLLALGLLVGGKLLNIQVPFFFKSIIDTLNVEIDPTTGGGAFAIAGTVIIGYGLARIGAGVFSELRNAVFANVAQGAIRRVARGVFTHLLNLDVQFHLTRQTGGLTRAIDRGTKWVSGRGISFLLSSIVFHVVPTALEISMVCGILVSRSPHLRRSQFQELTRSVHPIPFQSYKFGWDFAAVTLATMGAYTWFTIKTTSWRTKFRKQANAADNRAATMSVDSLINYEAVKHFNNEKFEIAQYDQAMKDYTKASVKISTSLAALNIGQNVIFSSALTAMMYLASKGIVNGAMTVGDLVMINQLVFQLSLPLNFLAHRLRLTLAGTVYRELRQSLIDMDTLFSLQSDSPTAKPLSLHEGGRIEFRNVSFGYHPSRPIFRDISFSIPAGKKVAIVGPSGSGKSTVFRLLFRFYEPSSGQILIDGQPLDQVTLESLRKEIGVVPQDTPLFHSDILHNVRYGRLDATDEEVHEAGRLARVSETVESMPEKWKTKVGERGLMISGGEKQRLAVARLLLKDPRILFFDEAVSALHEAGEGFSVAEFHLLSQTSALDSTTEAALMQNINQTLLSKARTSVFVAHRLKTVADSDLIIVLQDGYVAEQGTHAQLMAKEDGVYRGMWEQQNSMEGYEGEKKEL